MSLLVDAFLGSGVPVKGDPITSFQIVPLLGLQTATVVENCRPMVWDVVKLRFIARNCGERRIEIVRPGREGTDRQDQEDAEGDSITLLPGESVEYSVFRSWDAPGKQQFTLAYRARCARWPFARLSYPAVTIHVRPRETDKLMHWISYARAAHAQAQ